MSDNSKQSGIKAGRGRQRKAVQFFSRGPLSRISPALWIFVTMIFRANPLSQCRCILSSGNNYITFRLRRGLLRRQKQQTLSKFIDNLFAEFKLSRERHKIVFVTDNASNLVRCLSKELRLRCACHCLNLAVSKALQVPEVSEIVGHAKSIVQHFKRTNKQQKFSAVRRASCSLKTIQRSIF